MPAQVEPLLEGENDPHCPEALFISALLELGEFVPEKYHVEPDMIDAWRPLFDWCMDYQASSNEAPPISLARRRFPTFEVTSSVSPIWAAEQVQDQYSERAFRLAAQDALLLLNKGDLEGAHEAMGKATKPRHRAKPPASVFEHVEHDEDVPRFEVPYPSLMRCTGGIGAGELWYLAARFGAGKSWVALKIAAMAAQQGKSVCIHSLEMPARIVRRRLMRLLAGSSKKLLGQLLSGDPEQYTAAVDTIAKRTKGRIDILDPSHGLVNTLQSVRQSAYEYDLVIIDHVGLLKHLDGRRAVEDWRAMHNISNVLREITLAAGTPILGVAQVNREGETSSLRPPSPSKLAQADALGQDADVVVMAKRLSERVMVMEAAKVREGPGMLWHIVFDVEGNRFDEVGRDEARSIMAVDQDRATVFD